MVSMRPGETATQYIGPVGILGKQLMSASENFKASDNIRTILQGLPDIYLTTKEFIRELKKNCREAILMITAKKAELRAGSYKLGSYFDPKAQTERTYTSKDSHCQDGNLSTPNGAFHHCPKH